MNRAILSSVLSIGLLPLLLASPSANADFLYKTVNCPANNVTLVPAGGNATVKDIIVSSNKNQTVTFKFTGPNLTVMRLYLAANSTVVVNSEIEGDKDQAFKMDCSGAKSTKVSVTIVGSGSL